MKDIAIDLYKYFSKFVPAEVLSKSLTQSEASQKPGYSEIALEVQQLSQQRIPDIDTFVVSINEKFVSERCKNSKGIILFVEYGKISHTPNKEHGTVEHIAISVAHEMAESNMDNLNELLIMNRCFEILTDIIKTMHEEQSELDFCAGEELVTYPVEFSVIDTKEFYGCGGWFATFKNTKTVFV
jgi:hypothetical protein